MHCESPKLPTLDEFVDELQADLYVSGLQMAAMLSAQLQAELANGPDENSLKKWYTWTRGLNQLQTFRYAPPRQANKEQKQRGRPPQEPKIHLNGPAPQLRRPATPKSQTQPAPETIAPATSSTPTSTTPLARQNPPESPKMEKPRTNPATPINATKFDPINSPVEKGRHRDLTPIASGQFDQLNAYTAAKRLEHGF